MITVTTSPAQPAGDWQNPQWEDTRTMPCRWCKKNRLTPDEHKQDSVCPRCAQEHQGNH